jgi:hypothetical protein
MSQLFGDLHRPGSLLSPYSFGLFSSVIYLFNASPSVAEANGVVFFFFFSFLPIGMESDVNGGFHFVGIAHTLFAWLLLPSRFSAPGCAAACCYIALHLGGVA